MIAQRTRKVLPPATGTCKWVGFAANGNRLLEVTVNLLTQVYEVNEEPNGYTLHYYDKKLHEFIKYTIEFHNHGMWSCNCPDAINRPERKFCCKHTRALRKALTTLPF